MTAWLEAVSPKATSMIRMDHSHTLVTFHRFKAETAPATKQAIAETICLALEIHAQLEEEIFYPALREAMPDDPVVQKSVPEHDAMRRLIAVLRAGEPGTQAFDDTLNELMRDVIHHVADEETVLLPAAERPLADRLGELGARMTKRRFELAGPKIGQIASNSVRAMPVATMVMIAGALGLGALIARAGTRRSMFS